MDKGITARDKLWRLKYYLGRGTGGRVVTHRWCRIHTALPVCLLCNARLQIGLYFWPYGSLCGSLIQEDEVNPCVCMFPAPLFIGQKKLRCLRIALTGRFHSWGDPQRQIQNQDPLHGPRFVLKKEREEKVCAHPPGRWTECTLFGEWNYGRLSPLLYGFLKFLKSLLWICIAAIKQEGKKQTKTPAINPIERKKRQCFWHIDY